MSPEEIQQLLPRVERGEEDALGILYDTHVDAVYRYLHFRMPTNIDVEEMTTQVFSNMVKRLPNYYLTRASFEGWLYRIASAVIDDFYRQPERHLQPEEQRWQEQALTVLPGPWEELNADQQTILFLHFREGKNHDEITEILGISLNAVRNAQQRSLMQLATVLNPRGKSTRKLSRRRLDAQLL